MDDLISRHGTSAWLENMGHPNLAKMIMDEKRFPSAQPKKGKWDFVGDDMFKCLPCGELYTAKQLNGLRNCLTDPYLPLFCPHCGSYNGGVIDG